PAAGTALVGSAENIAQRIQEYESYGISAFILSGFPLITEVYRVADLLFPLLELDHGFELPKLKNRSSVDSLLNQETVV
ncbi:MAG: LLM class flavin-dependent oxidoreductase, partial [Acinetobacter sp.]